jgi:hypothetical protein
VVFPGGLLSVTLHQKFPFDTFCNKEKSLRERERASERERGRERERERERETGFP